MLLLSRGEGYAIGCMLNHSRTLLEIQGREERKGKKISRF